jgi:hypothetical protein
VRKKLKLDVSEREKIYLINTAINFMCSTLISYYHYYFHHIVSVEWRKNKYNIMIDPTMNERAMKEVRREKIIICGSRKVSLIYLCAISHDDVFVHVKWNKNEKDIYWKYLYLLPTHTSIILCWRTLTMKIININPPTPQLY